MKIKLDCPHCGEYSWVEPPEPKRRPGRPAKLPQRQELIDILNRHPNLSYPEIHSLYGWGGQPGSVKSAARAAGYARQTHLPRQGDGPLDAMDHDDFWSRSDQTMEAMDEIRRITVPRR